MVCIAWEAPSEKLCAVHVRSRTVVTRFVTLRRNAKSFLELSRGASPAVEAVKRWLARGSALLVHDDGIHVDSTTIVKDVAEHLDFGLSPATPAAPATTR